MSIDLYVVVRKNEGQSSAQTVDAVSSQTCITSDGQMQTDSSLFKETSIQTECPEKSIVLMHTQTETFPVRDSESQAVCSVTTIGAQTLSSCLKDIDCASQTVIDIVDEKVQTELLTDHQCIQVQPIVTQGNTQTDNCVHADLMTQTDTNVTSTCIQTAFSMFTETSCSTQTEVVCEQSMSTQTAAVSVSHADLQTEWHMSDSFIQTDFDVVDGSNQTELLADAEKSSQTDPVTIIIGDASFLMQKLRGSSMAHSPTKIQPDSNNDIEFEIQDGDGSASALMPGDDVYLGGPASSHNNHSRNLPVHDDFVGDNSHGDGAHQSSQFSRSSVVSPPTPRRSADVAANRGATKASGFRNAAPAVVNQPRPASSNSKGKYSCPVCPQTFIESPELYEHLQTAHLDACAKVKKPKGREGKTISQRTPPSVERGMVVNQRGSAIEGTSVVNRAPVLNQRRTDPGLFADDSDESDDDTEQEHVVMNKRSSATSVSSSATKRRRLDQTPPITYGRKNAVVK